MAIPARDELEALWQEAEVERAFWQEHQQEFVERYPDRFVAVRNGAVVATAATLMDLVHLLEEQALKPTDVWVHFIAATPQTTVLGSAGSSSSRP